MANVGDNEQIIFFQLIKIFSFCFPFFSKRTELEQDVSKVLAKF